VPPTTLTPTLTLNSSLVAIAGIGGVLCGRAWFDPLAATGVGLMVVNMGGAAWPEQSAPPLPPGQCPRPIPGPCASSEQRATALAGGRHRATTPPVHRVPSYCLGCSSEPPPKSPTGVELPPRRRMLTHTRANSLAPPHTDSLTY
jgi:hypothetical protein